MLVSRVVRVSRTASGPSRLANRATTTDFEKGASPEAPSFCARSALKLFGVVDPQPLKTLPPGNCGSVFGMLHKVQHQRYGWIDHASASAYKSEAAFIRR
jgi:hypothetical protein